MNKKILIAASLGLSLFAAAQSQTDNQKPKPSTSQTQSAPSAATGQSANKSKSAHDDWQQPSAVATKSATTKPVSNTSDHATGQTTGKRAHQPATVAKPSDKTPNQ